MHGQKRSRISFSRCTFIDNCACCGAGPDKKLKLSLNYPASVGRNMDEITRVIDALQLSAKYSVVRAHTLRRTPL